MSSRKLTYRKDHKDIIIEKAVWQWLLDHARITKNNTYIIQAEIPIEFEKFQQRLYARTDGLYRWSEKDLMEDLLKIIS